MPADSAKFHGAWSGKWSRSLDSKLYVVSIEENGLVDAFYTWGSYPGAGFGPGSAHVRGKIIEGRLILDKFSNGAVVSFDLDGENSLLGQYTLNKSTDVGRFIRSSPPDTSIEAQDVLEFHFTYPESNSIGSIVFDVAQSSCRYSDNWSGGRVGHIACALDSSQLELDGFAYPTPDGMKKPVMNIILEGIDRDRGCFTQLSYVWGYSPSIRGIAIPINSSRCG